MKKSFGLPLLIIVSCSLIFVCLGYVQLFRGITENVNNPATPEFWQVRHLALKWRNPVAEARQAFHEGDFASFDVTRIVSRNDHRVAQRRRWETVDKETPVLLVRQASTGLQPWPAAKDRDRQLVDGHQKFLDVSQQFALEFNREMTRLLNAR